MENGRIINTEASVTAVVKAALTRTGNARLKEIVDAFVEHAHALIREVDLTQEEFDAGLRFIAAIGQANTESHNEVVLAADVLGISTLVALAQHGIPGYQVELWWGVLAPAGTPAAIVGRLNAEINKIVQSPEMREAFMRDGAEPMTMSSAEFTKLIGDEITRWKNVAKTAGIKAD